jgi:hypothetical protein
MANAQRDWERVQAQEAKKGTRTSRWALALSAVAVAVSVFSLTEQRSINNSQRSINEAQRRVIEEARAEKQMEHAIRVSWWESGGQELNIQNRSLVPIKTVLLRYRATFADPNKGEDALVPNNEGPLFVFSGIAPCTIITIDQKAVEDYYLGPRRERPDSNAAGVTSVHWVRVDFTDVHGRWGVTSGGGPESVDPVNITDFDLEGSLMLSDLGFLRDTQDWVVEQSASDCGSG